MGKDIDEIVAMERRLWSSANDPKVYEQVIADGGISVIEPMGVVEKQQAVAMSAKGKPFRDVKITDLVVREFAPDCVVLAYHGQGRHEDQENTYHGTICSTYLKRDGRWQLVATAHQPWKPNGSGGAQKRS